MNGLDYLAIRSKTSFIKVAADDDGAFKAIYTVKIRILEVFSKVL